MKGGGDAVSAARAVLQTGEYDYAWNMQVEDEILQAPGAGRQGPRRHRRRRQHRAHPAQHHRPVDRGRRRALEHQDQASRCSPTRRCARRSALLVDRDVGPGAHLRPHRRRHRATSSTTRRASARRTRKWEFNVDKANQILDAAGWKRGADGIRAKDGKKLKFVYQTSINAPRQKTQAIVKQACQKAGIDIELKSVTASVYLLVRRRQPGHLHASSTADMQMYTTTMTQPDPELFMHQFTSWEVATKENKWQGRNITRWRNEEYDKAYPRRRGRARPGQARGAVHPDERPGGRRSSRDPGRLPAARARRCRTSCGRR